MVSDGYFGCLDPPVSIMTYGNKHHSRTTCRLCFFGNKIMLNPKGEVDGEGYLKRGTQEVPSLRQDDSNIDHKVWAS
jgi:hypothetical protein